MIICNMIIDYKVLWLDGMLVSENYQKTQIFTF